MEGEMKAVSPEQLAPYRRNRVVHYILANGLPLTRKCYRELAEVEPPRTKATPR
jgi:hypothetical protein